jgi:hypothetical protein
MVYRIELMLPLHVSVVKPSSSGGYHMLQLPYASKLWNHVSPRRKRRLLQSTDMNYTASSSCNNKLSRSFSFSVSRQTKIYNWGMATEYSKNYYTFWNTLPILMDRYKQKRPYYVPGYSTASTRRRIFRDDTVSVGSQQCAIHLKALISMKGLRTSNLAMLLCSVYI